MKKVTVHFTQFAGLGRLPHYGLCTGRGQLQR